MIHLTAARDYPTEKISETSSGMRFWNVDGSFDICTFQPQREETRYLRNVMYNAKLKTALTVMALD